MPTLANTGLEWAPPRSRISKSLGVGVVWLQRAYQPGNDDLFENEWIGPDFYLASQMSSLGIDPRTLGNIALAQQEIKIRNRHLCIEHAADDEHGGHRFSQQTLLDKRHLGEDLFHLFNRVHAFKDGHERGHLVEQ